MTRLGLRGGRIEQLITQWAIEHSDDAPHAGLGAMSRAQSGRQRVFIKHRGALIGRRRRWGCRRRAHEGVMTGNDRLVQQD